MRAMVIEDFGDINQMRLAEIPTPEPQKNEVLIQISYAAINPVDWKICAGFLRERMPYEFPITLGWDVAGVISKVGADVTHYKVGDEVFAYARKSQIKDGTLAEYICLDANNIAFKPKTLQAKEAAAIPLTGLTAWQCLFDAVHLKQGDVVFIPAGAGGVGSMAIQFSKYAGATVVTTASSKNHDYLKKLGADIAIDYHTENVIDRVQSLYPQGVDVVFDTMGGSTLEDSFKFMKVGARLVSIISKVTDDIADKHKIQAHYVFVQPSGSQLKTIGELLDTGKIRVPHIKEFTFENAREAMTELKAGHTIGKIVVKIR